MTATLLAAGTVLMGLSAGLFATFSYVVMPGLRRAPDAAFVDTMRGINVAILNPVFALTYGGSFLVTVVALVLGWDEASRPWVVAGLALHAVGAYVITFAVNVPMNDALEAGTDDAATLRTAFEGRWTRWNHARSVLITAGFACLVVALLQT
ncbi:anthrone oxygenase family protein [Aeromicrobium sp. NPDC092404]|uniref:anthrone oxygenase family protein n=1 Tax=Aeromicrobium sp. NPDC092404 TaxID=3154976 RepID=UPI003428FB93